MDTRSGHFFDGLRRRVVSDRQLAEVVAQYNGPAGTEAFWGLAASRFKVMPIGAGIKLPTQVRQYLEPRSDWQAGLDGQTRPPRQYRPGYHDPRDLDVRTGVVPRVNSGEPGASD